jgi:hypothetical protein
MHTFPNEWSHFNAQTGHNAATRHMCAFRPTLSPGSTTGLPHGQTLPARMSQARRARRFVGSAIADHSQLRINGGHVVRSAIADRSQLRMHRRLIVGSALADHTPPSPSPNCAPNGRCLPSRNPRRRLSRVIGSHLIECVLGSTGRGAGPSSRTGGSLSFGTSPFTHRSVTQPETMRPQP